MAEIIWNQGYTQNRELSWLEFNAACARGGGGRNRPLLERFKFLAIFTSNLDEFFMIRGGQSDRHGRARTEPPRQQVRPDRKRTARPHLRRR